MIEFIMDFSKLCLGWLPEPLFIAALAVIAISIIVVIIRIIVAIIDIIPFW